MYDAILYVPWRMLSGLCRTYLGPGFFFFFKYNHTCQNGDMANRKEIK